MRAAEPSGPIGDGELAALFAPLAKASRIAVAVSGGCDSLALLDCLDRWRRRRKRAPELVVMTVDHGLREESSKDAAAVAAIARARGLRVRTLHWEGTKPAGDIEAAARTARYRLLIGAAREEGAKHLVVGHHRDDQAETLLLRLARGSGLFGLAAMRPQTKAVDVTIFRPFLEVPRTRLMETVARAGLEPREDAMNTDPRFARARLRRIMPLLAAEGIDPAGLAATAARLAQAAEAVDAAATELMDDALVLDGLAVAAIDAEVFFTAPKEIRLRALARLLLAVGGDNYPPRFERLAALEGDMAGHDGRARFKRTLAGSVIEWRRVRFLIYRELGREGLPGHPVESGFAGVWDHRFKVEIGPGAPRGLRLAALGEAGRKALEAEKGSAPAGALAVLPALWRDNALVSVPSLAHFDGETLAFAVSARSILAERLAEPPQFPDILAPG